MKHVKDSECQQRKPQGSNWKTDERHGQTGNQTTWEESLSAEEKWNPAGTVKDGEGTGLVLPGSSGVQLSQSQGCTALPTPDLCWEPRRGISKFYPNEHQPELQQWYRRVIPKFSSVLQDWGQDLSYGINKGNDENQNFFFSIGGMGIGIGTGKPKTPPGDWNGNTVFLVSRQKTEG